MDGTWGYRQKVQDRENDIVIFSKGGDFVDTLSSNTAAPGSGRIPFSNDRIG
jgi:hypothetical protein